MTSEMKKNLALYNGKQVRVVMVSGIVLNGTLRIPIPGDWDAPIEVGAAELKCHEVADLRLMGTITGRLSPEGRLQVIGASDRQRGEYCLDRKDCGALLQFSRYQYGERTAEITCHLTLEEGRVAVKDVEVLKEHFQLNRSLLDGKQFLFRLGKSRQWTPARLVWEGDTLLMRRYSRNGQDDVDTIISSDDISDVTKCPGTGSGDKVDRVTVRLEDGQSHTGYVLSASDSDEQFTLRDEEEKNVCVRYSDLSSIRYWGTYDGTQKVYDGKYRYLEGSDRPPLKASFVVGVAPEGYVAKHVSSELTEASPQEKVCYGFILFHRSEKGYGFLGPVYNRATRDRGGTAYFKSEALRFNYDPTKIYAVRYTYVERPEYVEVCSIEPLPGQSWPWESGNDLVFSFGETGNVQTRAMTNEEKAAMPGERKSGRTILEDNPLTGIESLLGHKVEIETRQSGHFYGYLREVEEDFLKLFRALKGGSDRDMVRVPKAEITRVWAYDAVSTYGSQGSFGQSGMAYIGSVGFNIMDVVEESERSCLKEGQMVRYRVVKSNKGLTAQDVMCLDVKDEAGYILGRQNDGRYIVLETDQEGYEKPWLRRGNIQIVPAYCGCFIPHADTQGRKVSMKIYRRMSGRELCRVIVWAEQEAAGQHRDIPTLEAKLQGVPPRQDGVEYAYGIAVSCAGGIVHILDTYINPDELPDAQSVAAPPSHRYFELEKVSVFSAEPLSNSVLNRYCALVRYVPGGQMEHPTKGLVDGVELSHPVVILERFRKDEFSFLAVCGPALRLALGRRAGTAELKRTQADLRQQRGQRNIGPLRMEEIIKQLIECDIALLRGESEPSKQMHLLFEIAMGYYDQGNYPQAKRYCEQWLDVYRTLETLDPAKARNVRNSLEAVKRRIELCENGGQEPWQAEKKADKVPKAIPAEAVTQRDPDDIVAQEKFVYGRLNGIKLEEKLSPAFEVLKNPSPSEKQLKELRELLRSRGEDEEPETQWVLARGWDKLWLKSRETADLDQRNRCLARALVGQKKLSREQEVKYWCAWALRLDPELEKAAALYLSQSMLPPDRRRQTVPASVKEVVLSAQKDGGWEDKTVEAAVRDCVVLCGPGPGDDDQVLANIQDRVVKWLSADDLEKFRTCFDRELARCLDQGVKEEDLPYWGTLRSLIGKAIDRYSKVVEEVRRYDGSQIADSAQFYLQQIARAEPWIPDDEKDGLFSQVKDILDKLKSYGEKGAFKEKSQLLRDCGNKVETILKVNHQKKDQQRKGQQKQTRQAVSLVTRSLLQPILDRSYPRLVETYRTLLLTTRPSVKLDIGDYIKATPVNDSLDLHMREAANGNHAQNAKKVKVVVQPSDVFEVLEPPKRRPIGSGKFGIDIRLKLKRPDIETITLSVCLEYHYDTPGKEGFETFDGKKMERIDVPVVLDTKPREKIDNKYLNVLRNNIFAYRPSNDEGRALVREAREILENRARDVDRIMQTLCQSNRCEALSDTPRWVALYGEWRVGKTTVLNLVEAKIRAKFPRACVVRFDCPVAADTAANGYEDTTARRLLAGLQECLSKNKMRSRNDRDWWEKACRQFEKAAGENGIDPEKIEVSDSPLTFEKLKPVLADLSAALRAEDPNAALIFLVDEFTHLYKAIKDDPANRAFIRRWAQFCVGTDAYDDRPGTGCLFVIAGGEFMEELMSAYDANAWQRATDSFQLEYLSREHTEKYVRFVIHRDEFFNEQDREEYNETMDYIFELTQGNANLLCRLFSKLIDYINEATLTRRTINKKLLSEFLDSIDFDETTRRDYFLSLFNPYNEDKGDTADSGRLEGAKIAAYNRDVLDAVVAEADPGNHKCTRRALVKRLVNIDAPDLDEVIETLVRRKVLVSEGAGDEKVLKIRVDLYYQLERRRMSGKG